MVNQVPASSYNKSVFSNFTLGKDEKFFITVPAEDNESGRNEPENSKRPHRTKTLAFVIGSAALFGGFGVLALSRGLPKNTGKYLENIKSYLEKRLEKSSLKGSDSWNEFYIYSIRKVNSFIEKAQSVNNVVSLKDALFKNLMSRTPLTSKIHSGISNFFEKISKKTVTSSYKNTGKKFQKMFSAFDNLDEVILKNNPDEVIVHEGKNYTKRQLIEIARKQRAGIKSSVEGFISDSEQSDRYKQIKAVTSNLYNQFWDESFKDFWSKNNKLLKKEMWQTFIPQEKIAQGKRNLADEVSSVRNKISYTDADKRNLINNQVSLLENLVAPSDKEGFKIIKKLKWFLKNPDGFNADNEVFTRELAKLRERPLQEGLSETVAANQTKLKETCIKSINDLLSKNNSGELQKMAAIYKKIAPYEYSLIESKVTKAVSSFDKSLNLETVDFFNKVRDLELGSAPTDILSIITSGSIIAYGLTRAKDKDERYSVVLNSGIPIVGAICISLLCAARLIPAAKSALLGIMSGLVLNRIGRVTDESRKKYPENPAV